MFDSAGHCRKLVIFTEQTRHSQLSRRTYGQESRQALRPLIVRNRAISAFPSGVRLM